MLTTGTTRESGSTQQIALSGESVEPEGFWATRSTVCVGSGLVVVVALVRGGCRIHQKRQDEAYTIATAADLCGEMGRKLVRQ